MSAAQPETRPPLWQRITHWRRDALVAHCDRGAVLTHVAEAGALAPRFAFMTVMSCGIAVLGLLQNSAAVIIGAMLISPLMAPIVELGMGLATFDAVTVRGALRTVIAGVVLALVAAGAIVAVSPLQDATPEILARTAPNLFDLLVAVFSGLAGAYATITRKGETLVGVAIATALMPPLAVLGYGLALMNWHIALGAGFLFMTNLLAIALSVTIVARLYGFGGRDTPHQTLWQAVLILATFTLLSIPLGLALRRIAVQSRVQGVARAILDRGAARVSGRLTGLRLQNSGDDVGVDIDAVLMLPAHVPGLAAAWERELRQKTGRPVSLRLREVLTTSDAAVEKQQSSLAELRDSIEQLRAARSDAAAEQQVTRDQEAELARSLAARLGTIEAMRGSGWRLQLDPQLGLSLPAAFALEQRMQTAAPQLKIIVVPALQAVPAWPERATRTDSPASSDAAAPAMAAAWALKRWASGPVALIAHVRKRSRNAATALAQTAALLRSQGVEVGTLTQQPGLSAAQRAQLGSADALIEVQPQAAGSE